MNPGFDRLFVRIKDHYDKVMTFAVMLVFAGSLALLGVKIMLMRQIQADFEGWLRGLRPLNEQAAPVDARPFESAQAALTAPVLMTSATNDENAAWMFIPETRFNCRECRNPVSILAENCPFCQALVTPIEPETIDHDGDGMPTGWEQKYGLDPFDPSDAHQDFDGDGFTNLEEFLAGTDPTDPKSHPPRIERVVLDQITGARFGLQFMSRARTQAGLRFGLNHALPDGQTRTSFVSIGDIIEGFVIEGFEEKSARADPPKLGVEDVSELTLLTPKGDRIVLVMDRAVQHVELTARIALDLVGISERWELRKSDIFEMDGKAYTVIDIDAEAGRVILSEKQTEKEITIRRLGSDRPDED